MSLEDILLQQVQRNVDRAKRTKETSMEYAPSPGQMANFSGMLAPGAGYADFFGEYPSLPSYDQPVTEAFSNEPYPSFAENLQRGGFGGYFDASMQGLGAAGDTLYAAPVVGPPLGTALKTLGAFGAAMRAGSRAGKGAKTETGIATLGKQPMFTPEDTINLAYTPDGSYSPAIKDLIEKAPPSLKGQGIVQWANKNLKPKELEVLGIEDFIKANPKATLRETVEGISGNKVVIGKKVLGGGEGQVIDFESTYPLEDPISGEDLYDYLREDIYYELNKGNFEELSEYASEYAEARLSPDELASYDNNFTFQDVVDRTEKALISGASNETLDDVIDELARQRYEYDPPEMIRITGVDTSDTTFAFGHPDYGYRIFVDGVDKTPSNTGMQAFSQTEAQIQLRDAMADEGYDFFPTSADEYDEFYGETQYKRFIDGTLPGGKNYREIIYTYEGADETHELAHYGFNPDEGNYLAHALVRDRKLADGTETLHGDELQSDLHKNAKDYGYNTPETVEKIKSGVRDGEQDILKAADIVEDMLIKKGVYTKDFVPDNLSPRIFEDTKNYSRDDTIYQNLQSIRNMGRGRTPRLENEMRGEGYTSRELGDSPDDKNYSITAYNASELRDFLRNQATPESADNYNPLTDFQWTQDEFDTLNNLITETTKTAKLQNSLDFLLPNYPYKDNYHEMLIKKMLLQAVEEGKPAISISGSAPIKARYVSGNDAVDEKNFRFYENLYDKKIPSYMQKLANKYGGEFQKNSKLNLEDTFDNTTYQFEDGITGTEKYTEDAIANADANVIKITEEMRNKILLEGLPDFATGGIVNKGIARLRTAKKFTEGIVDLGLY